MQTTHQSPYFQDSADGIRNYHIDNCVLACMGNICTSYSDSYELSFNHKVQGFLDFTLLQANSLNDDVKHANRDELYATVFRHTNKLHKTLDNIARKHEGGCETAMRQERLKAQAAAIELVLPTSKYSIEDIAGGRWCSVAEVEYGGALWQEKIIWSTRDDGSAYNIKTELLVDGVDNDELPNQIKYLSRALHYGFSQSYMTIRAQVAKVAAERDERQSRLISKPKKEVQHLLF